MPSVFVDASAWIAALVPRQPRHAEAREFYARAAAAGYRFVTTPLVVAETHALILRGLGPQRAAQFLDVAFNPHAHAVVATDSDLMSSAVDRWIRGYADQPFSLCDAVSFEVMRNERLTTAFAFDHHFRVAGYETIPV
jgi:predicted nucleic acid-binding protein